MKNIDKIFIGILIGSAFPLLLSLLAVILWFYINRNTEWVLIYLATGLILGLIIDFKFLKIWIIKRYELPIWVIIGMYIFYNIEIYGFFMGVPVVNILMGLIAGYYYGKKIEYQNISPDKMPAVIKKISLFTCLIMSLICLSSAVIALMDESTGENLRLMFGLNFPVTKAMILAIILFGGFILILSQFFVTKLVMTKTIKLNI
jgi:hypothetical protein